MVLPEGRVGVVIEFFKLGKGKDDFNSPLEFFGGFAFGLPERRQECGNIILINGS